VLPPTVATTLLNKAFYRVHGLQHHKRVVAVFTGLKGTAAKACFGLYLGQAQNPLLTRWVC